MQFRPIASALLRNKLGALLVVLQVTMTLAILCNALFIVQQRLAQMMHPSGIDEADTFVIDNQWIGKSNDLPARVRADLASLRALPGVAGAYDTNAYPFENGGWSFGFTLQPDGKDAGRGVAVYFADEETIRTLGLKLVAGRDFSASDIVDYRGVTERPATNGVIVTRALAERLQSGGDVLGRSVTMLPMHQHGVIVGIVDRLEAPWVLETAPDVDRAALLPYRYIAPASFYVVRARPGQLGRAMKAARLRLLELSRARVIGQVTSLAEARHAAYRFDRLPAIVLGIVCASLLIVTAFGIIGLASFWVVQRRRQIGIRRALGATRWAIAGYFQTENLMISGAGALLGVALAVSVNLWMVRSYALPRLPYAYLLVGFVALLALGQLAVLWPAMRAASVPPAVVTRNS